MAQHPKLFFNLKDSSSCSSWLDSILNYFFVQMVAFESSDLGDVTNIFRSSIPFVGTSPFQGLPGHVYIFLSCLHHSGHGEKKIEIPFLFKEKGNNIQLTRSTLWKLNFSVATFWCRDFTNFARGCFSLKFFYNFVKVQLLECTVRTCIENHGTLSNKNKS